MEDNFGFRVARILPQVVVRFKERFWHRPKNMVYIDRLRLIPEYLFLKLVVNGNIVGMNHQVDLILPIKENRSSHN